LSHPKKEATSKYDFCKFSSKDTSEVTRRDFSNFLEVEIENRCRKGINVASIEQINDMLKEAAGEVLGIVKNDRIIVSDKRIEQLSVEQRKLHMISQNTDLSNTQRKLLKRKRSKIMREIRTISRQNALDKIISQVEEIERLKDGAQFFKAANIILRKRSPKVSLKDTDGFTVGTDNQTAKIASKYFENELNHVDPDLESTLNEIASTESLQNPITENETFVALGKLNNRRATGEDGISGELLKYARGIISAPLTEVFNKHLRGEGDLNLGRGIIVILQKIGKEKGNCKSLRPISLLNNIRKTYSLIILRRIQPKIDSYLSANQSGFRKNRSCADAVWAHRWIAARCERFKKMVFILRIDLSKAFDTITRSKLLFILKEIVDKDELRMIAKLLTLTSSTVRIGSFEDEPFFTNRGIPQGDSLSPILFIIYLEAVLRDVCCHLNISMNDLIIYADDSDFIVDNTILLDVIQTKAPEIFKKWGLEMNTSKTDITTIWRQKKKDENWRLTRKLGSLIGEEEDVKRRKVLAQIAFQNMTKRKILAKYQKRSGCDYTMPTFVQFCCIIQVHGD
jgi:hypothetical protein